MKQSVGRGLLLFGFALVVAVALRALANLLQAEPFDPWSVVLAVGCISMSIGIGLLKKK